MKPHRSANRPAQQPALESPIQALDSQQLLKATLDSSFNFIQVFAARRDQTGTIIDFSWLLTNRRWDEAYGDMIGKSLLEQNPAVVHTGIFAQMVQVTRTGVPQTHEHYYPYEQFDGWFHQTLTRLGDGVVLTTEEITGRKRAEQALQTSEAKYRSLFESIEVGYCLVQVRDNPGQPLDYQFIEVNPAFEHQTGLAGAQGQWMRQLRPHHEAYWFEIYHQVARTGQPVQFEHLARELDGRWYRVHAFRPQAVPAGQVAILFEDITPQRLARQALIQSEASYRTLAGELEQRVAERTQELRRANQDLTRSNDNLQQFASVASHDLQEPLRKVRQFGDLLNDRYADQLGLGVDYLHRMQSAASRMSTLINDLLSYSRIVTQPETARPVDLNQVLDGVLSDLELRIAETGARIERDALPIVNGDSSQLGQLFSNLLANALKFHRRGEKGSVIPPRISVRSQPVAAVSLPASVKPTRVRDWYHQIEVADNGIGFDEQYVERIFQIFQRLHGRSEFRGTGIGLAICEKVVANHGGAIRARSQVGLGATFSIYLPVE